MDHSARWSMNNAANCVKYGELQGSRNRNQWNAYSAFYIPMLEARLSEGLLEVVTFLGTFTLCLSGRVRGLGVPNYMLVLSVKVCVCVSTAHIVCVFEWSPRPRARSRHEESLRGLA